MAGFDPVSFVAQIGISYLLGRISAQDGPRLANLDAASGEYGIPMPLAFGRESRFALPFLDSDEIKETEHEVQDYSEVVGAISGAAQGFLIGGPVGAAIGAVAGFLFGAAAPDQKYYTYSITMALLVADRRHADPIEDLPAMWALGRKIFDAAEQEPTAETFDDDGRLIMREYGKNRYFKTLRIYGGGFDQAPDSILEDLLGEQPAYRTRAYVVIEDLQLEFFGNAAPPVEGLIQSKDGELVSQFLETVCARAGIDTEHDLSTSEMAGHTIRGYAITQDANCWDAVKPLLAPYRFDGAEVAGQVRFLQRAQSWRSSIGNDDLGAYEWGNTPPPRIAFTRDPDTKLPETTSLTFIDPARDWQANTASSYRSGGDANSNFNLSLALTLTADEGATAAATMHWDACLGRTGAAFNLTDSFIGIEPGRVYALPVAGSMLPYRVTRKARGVNGIIEVEALSDEDVVYKGTVRGSSGTLPPQESTLAAETVVVPIDMPMLSDGHDDFGFYLAMGATQPYWTRGRIEVSGDAVTYATAVDATQAAVMGEVDGVLGPGLTTGLDDTLDTLSVLTVELLHDGMALSSATDAQLDANRNFAFVGKEGKGEYIQFKTATKVAPATWELTNLRRGRRGTDYALSGHVAAEKFVLLGEGGIYRIVTTDDSGWGDGLTLRGVTLHGDTEDADTVTFANTGQGKRPYSPVNLTGSFDGGGDLDLTMDSRSRFDTAANDSDVPESFEIDIIRNGVVVRTELLAMPAYTYTAADQASDGFTEGDAIVVEGFRTNADYGRSKARRFAILAPEYTLHLEDGTTAFLMEDGIEPIGLG